MKRIPTRDAVGHILCHDMTQIIPNVSKDARFKKGHIVTPEDIPILLEMGKESLYVWEQSPGIIHENDAAFRLCQLCINDYMHPTQVKEGKIELIADISGLFRVSVERLKAVNMIQDIIIATRHTNIAVKRGDRLAGMRVIPLAINESRIKEAENAAGHTPLLELLPFKLKTAGIITTGSEIFNGLIKDQFTPVVKNKLHLFDISVTEHLRTDDKTENILYAIKQMQKREVDIILCTGGMSVDPDDRTPGAIRRSGADIVFYGAPVLPGAMFALGYFKNGVPIAGLPGCVMYAGATIFDLLLPRLAAGVRINRSDVVNMGHGGLCVGCNECHWPNCPFGKGA